jgi:phenylpyruvate tautomerase PptA (4-oxalocrotonate tautomerase family)
MSLSEITATVPNSIKVDATIHVVYRDMRSRNHGPGGVSDCAGNAAKDSLADRRKREQQTEDEQEKIVPGHGFPFQK